MDEEYDEDKLTTIETCLKMISELVLSFKLETEADSRKRKEFLNAYIGLEDKILEILLDMKNKEYVRGEEYLKRFTEYWSGYQDTWDSLMWSEYDYYRAMPNDLIGNNFDNSKIDEENMNPDHNRESKYNHNLK